jgi:hypothetical protein
VSAGIGDGRAGSPNWQYHFFYDPASELTQAILPPEGHVRWDHLSFTYTSNRTIREAGIN